MIKNLSLSLMVVALSGCFYEFKSLGGGDLMRLNRVTGEFVLCRNMVTPETSQLNPDQKVVRTYCGDKLEKAELMEIKYRDIARNELAKEEENSRSSRLADPVRKVEYENFLTRCRNDDGLYMHNARVMQKLLNKDGVDFDLPEYKESKKPAECDKLEIEFEEESCINSIYFSVLSESPVSRECERYMTAEERKSNQRYVLQIEKERPTQFVPKAVGPIFDENTKKAVKAP